MQNVEFMLFHFSFILQDFFIFFNISFYLLFFIIIHNNNNKRTKAYEQNKKANKRENSVREIKI